MAVEVKSLFLLFLLFSLTYILHQLWLQEFFRDGYVCLHSSPKHPLCWRAVYVHGKCGRPDE